MSMAKKVRCEHWQVIVVLVSFVWQPSVVQSCFPGGQQQSKSSSQCSLKGSFDHVNHGTEQFSGLWFLGFTITIYFTMCIFTGAIPRRAGSIGSFLYPNRKTKSERILLWTWSIFLLWHHAHLVHVAEFNVDGLRQIFYFRLHIYSDDFIAVKVFCAVILLATEYSLQILLAHYVCAYIYICVYIVIGSMRSYCVYVWKLQNSNKWRVPFHRHCTGLFRKTYWTKGARQRITAAAIKLLKMRNVY